MTSVRSAASVAPSTVTRVSTGAVPPRRAVRATRAQVAALRQSRVHPLVLVTALELAGGDASRLLIVSASEVVVRN